ncbi:hypothetical protein [Geodermatophilus marinus]|uniref:hypothetical protein n=1 Tax=Geodermatophilus sp. LHW52908 TaxID=2303986 RepID=UPI000E3BF9E0|nr:hypothetical protein [Geodermatophilus sp. LHW52908]RFU22483.1 hypothetical protein D0Z06_04315 [Geodermatophilus sp. LHW52908]
MSAPRPCYRHSGRWMAYCDDCTSWHLSRAIAARDAAGHDHTASTAAVVTLRPAPRRAVLALVA